MTDHQVSRTLLKSPPELWAECSDPQSLTKHLDDCFGEIRITRLEPEQAVAWEGEHVSGTVKLEPSGWGTKVTLTASAAEGKPLAPETPSAAVSPPRADVSPPRADVSPPRADVSPPPADTEPIDRRPSEPAPTAQSEPLAHGTPVKATRSGFRAKIWRFLLGPEPVQGQPPVIPPAEPEPALPEGLEPAEPEAAAPEPAAPEAAEPEAAAPEAPREPEAPKAPGEPEARPNAAAELAEAEAALNAALDSLGKAHHRPFSRA